MNGQANQLTEDKPPMNLAPSQHADEQPDHPAYRSLWSKRLAMTIFLGLTAVFLISVFYHPAPADQNGNYFSVCGFKNLTGLPCPGCGLTHSFCEIGKGHLYSAIGWNWMGLPLFIFFIFLWFQALFILTRQFNWAIGLDKLAARLNPLRWLAIAFGVYGIGRIVYLLLHRPGG
jgi:hypothetical protein